MLTRNREGSHDAAHAEHQPATTNDTWALVAAAQQGDLNAFSELYTTHVDTVLKYVWRRTGNKALAEDITSEAFTRAFARLHTLRHRGSTFRSWIITIARNVMTDEYLSPRHRLVSSMPIDFDLAADSADPHAAAFILVLRQNLREAFRHLTEDQRSCIVLRFFEGLSVEETAERMGRSRQCVRSLQFRAIRTLAKIVSPELALK